MIKVALLPASLFPAPKEFSSPPQRWLSQPAHHRARWMADRPQHRLGASVQHLPPLCRTVAFRSHPSSKNSLKNVAPSLQDAHDPFNQSAPITSAFRSEPSK